MCDAPPLEHYADDRVQLTYQIVELDHRLDGLDLGTSG
jgi:hypothetical protein